jgi:hypothetical protein
VKLRSSDPTGPPRSYFEFINACAQPGCPLCRLAEGVVDRYIDSILHENVTDQHVRADFRAALGYCHEHAHVLLTRTGAALGSALLYRTTLRLIENELDRAAYTPGFSLRRAAQASEATAATVTSLSPRRVCPACAQRDQFETLTLQAAIKALDQNDADLRAALERSTGLCLPHLRRALELIRSRTAFDLLMGHARTVVAGLGRDLDEYIRKRDAQFASERFGPEADSWRRAIAWFTGS